MQIEDESTLAAVVVYRSQYRARWKAHSSPLSSIIELTNCYDPDPEAHRNILSNVVCAGVSGSGMVVVGGLDPSTKALVGVVLDERAIDSSLEVFNVEMRTPPDLLVGYQDKEALNLVNSKLLIGNRRTCQRERLVSQLGIDRIL